MGISQIVLTESVIETPNNPVVAWPAWRPLGWVLSLLRDLNAPKKRLAEA